MLTMQISAHENVFSFKGNFRRYAEALRVFENRLEILSRIVRVSMYSADTRSPQLTPWRVSSRRLHTLSQQRPRGLLFRSGNTRASTDKD